MDLGDGHSGALRGWQRSIRANGGFWLGEGEMIPGKGGVTMDDCLAVFLEGMARRVVERVGGMVTWEGFIAEMDLTLNGITYRRSLLDRANAVRVIYSKVGDNLFSNGSAESSAWSAVGAPTTRERVTSWVTRGTYGMHVVADTDDGVQIGSGLTIVAGRAYQCQVTVNVESGEWKLAVHRGDNDDELVSIRSAGDGNDVLRSYVGEDNTYAGNVYVNLTAQENGSEIYADAAVFQLQPYRTETRWYTDDDSIEEYGRIEDVLLEAGMTDEAAGARAAKEIAERAWPRSVPPDRYDLNSGSAQFRQDGLSVLFAGYAWTLNWRHALAGGTDTASNHVSSLVSEAELVSAGSIESNSLSTQVEEKDPILIWDALEEIIDAGDGSGNRWMGGVYADRLFQYEQAPTTVAYHYRNGRLLSIHGGPIEPWFVRPGLVRLDNAPVGPGAITGNDTDDPRNIFLEEVTYTAPNSLRFRRSVL
jgi:hypothetical protein